MFNIFKSIILGKPNSVQVILQNVVFHIENKFVNPKRFIFVSPSSNSDDIGRFLKRHLASDSYPNHLVIKLPALSPTMEVGRLASWVKNEGDEVIEGDVIAEVETDKATMGVEVDEPGFLAKILIAAGTADVKVGTPICIIVEKKADIGAFKNYKPEATASAPPPPLPSPSQPSVPASSPPLKQDLPKRKSSMDFKKSGSPPTSAPAPAGGKYTDVPITNIRQIIAKRLLQSKQEYPHFYLTIEVVINKMEAMRKVLNAELAKSGVKISVNDIIVKATSLACKAVPEANASWMGNVIRQYHTVDVSVAVSTPTGLITPIVFDADTKQIRDISTEIKELAKKAKLGKLQPKEFQGGTFTVSNLGMFGIDNFMAIINPPQSCILAVGTLGEKLFMTEGGISSIAVKKYITVTLSCDHRVVDGAVGAQWLQSFKKYIENPKSMF